MCGIAGVLFADRSRPVQPAVVEAMAASMTHRGPDDAGCYCDQNLGLGFRRLAIIDLTPMGHQPMSNPEGSVWVVFNGEIYNFQELRAGLQSHGSTFRGRSDTEVIIRTYERYGEAGLEQFNGMFALALWDARERKLLLARDRVGKKPLYYYVDDERLLFASEIKGILTVPGVDTSLDVEAVEEYFSFGFISGERTIYRRIRQVAPGHLLIARDGKVAHRRFWQLRVGEPLAITEKEACTRLRELLEDAVRIRMVSDVPLGAFLSGGLDSSAVVALMTRVATERVRTFSIGFREAKFDETRHARKVAEALGTIHVEEVVDPDYRDVVETVLSDFDEPFGDSSALPTYVVSRLTRGHVTVALSGDGGDEVFAGYDLHAIALREQVFDRLPRSAKAGLGRFASVYPEWLRGGNMLRRAALADPLARYISRFELVSDGERQQLYSSDMRRRIGSYRGALEKLRFFAETPGLDLLTRLQHNDFCHYLPDDILVKVDRMSMLNSLETRSPLLDHRVVEFVFQLPPNFKIRNGIRKSILREVVKDLLPPSILERGKQGFAVPVAAWFRNELREFAADHIFSARMREAGLFDMDYARKLISLHQSGMRDMSRHLWLLLAFSVWLNHSPDGRVGLES
jgi:asparagine synthase (glutamine-hydrolysing)